MKQKISYEKILPILRITLASCPVEPRLGTLYGKKCRVGLHYIRYRISINPSAFSVASEKCNNNIIPMHLKSNSMSMSSISKYICTHPVSKLYMTAGEVSWTPAGDRYLTQPLFGGHSDSKH